VLLSRPAACSLWLDPVSLLQLPGAGAGQVSTLRSAQDRGLCSVAPAHCDAQEDPYSVQGTAEGDRMDRTVERRRGSLEKGLSLWLGWERSQRSLQHLIVSESREVLRQKHVSTHSDGAADRAPDGQSWTTLSNTLIMILLNHNPEPNSV